MLLGHFYVCCRWLVLIFLDNALVIAPYGEGRIFLCNHAGFEVAHRVGYCDVSYDCARDGVLSNRRKHG